jgi:hypothetical protein
MSKQDRQGARTATDIERRYNFRKSFSQVMGVAEDARITADRAEDAAKKPSENLTSKEVFDLLTSGGEEQGFYRDGDQIYLNAEIIKVLNLIADHLKSVKDTQVMEIDGAGLSLALDGKILADLKTTEYGDRAQFSIYVYDSATGAPMIDTHMTDGAIMVAASMDYYGKGDVATMGIDPYTGTSYAQFEQLNDKTIYWEDNGDGTFTLKGR